MIEPSLQFSVPCLEVPQEEGRPPSFHYLFYELPLPEFPYRVTFFVCNGWCNGQGRFVQSTRILKPDHVTPVVETGEQPFELAERETPFMAVNCFQEIPFESPGVHWIQVNLDGEMRLEYPLVVRQADRP